MWSDESGVGTDENSEAGIWQSGGGLVSDLPGRIVLASGNGVSPVPAPSNSPPATLSESVIGLTIGGGGQIAPSQFFAPSDAPTLDQNDEDLGSGGPVALPDRILRRGSAPASRRRGREGRARVPDRRGQHGRLQAGRRRRRRGAADARALQRRVGPPGRLRRPGRLGVRARERRRRLPAGAQLRTQRRRGAAAHLGGHER